MVRKAVKSCVACHKLEGPSYHSVPAPGLLIESVR